MDESTKEIWKDVIGYEGVYYVSNYGSIKSNPRNGTRGGIRIQYVGKFGYPLIILTKDGKSKTFLTHRIVATSFIGNPENNPQVNHKNGIKTDNRVENLEWATRSEQAKHRYIAGLDSNKGVKHPQSKLTDNQVLEIRKHPTDHKTRLRLAKKYKISKSHVFSIQTRKTWAHI